MTTSQGSSGEGTRSQGDSLLGDVRAEHSEAEVGRKARDAARELTSLIETDRYVGDLISMDYDTAEVLIHDRLRQDVGGVPHGCLLIATRIKPDEQLNLDEPQTCLILLRALRGSTLPNDAEMKRARLEAGQRAADTPENWDEAGKTDQFTLDQMRYAGAHCRILGTFRMHFDGESNEWGLEYGGDINNFYAGQGMKVYKPAGEALQRIANYRKNDALTAEPVSIGTLRYAASIHGYDTPEAVPIYVTAENFLAQRTALFGMTRTGKSNTTKTIASAVFRLRLGANKEHVGQLIFDPNGEYANDNPQDQGCLRNLANLDESVKDDVVTYGLQPHPNDPERNITKFNFYGDALPRNNTSKQEWDEALESLYQGKQIINQALSEESAGYVKAFMNADIEAPQDVDDFSVSTRYRRSLFVYQSALAWAGFETTGQGLDSASQFKVNTEMVNLMGQSDTMASYVNFLKKEMPWDIAVNFCRALAEWVKTREFKNYDTQYAGTHDGRSWSDERLLSLLRIFDNTRGREIMQQARQWHGLNSTSDYAEDIIEHIRQGRLVIFDQALGNPEMNEQAAARIMKGIFAAQQQAFVNPIQDPISGEIRKPDPVLVYVEEAHTLLPEGRETDVTNIWARVAKEGAKFNIGLVYSTQEPSSIQSNILKNTENWFIAHLNNTDETRQLNKYNDFTDFTDGIIKVNETGFVRVRTLSSPYTLPVQITKFTAPQANHSGEGL